MEKDKIPVKKNGVYTVNIEDISSEGNGIARIDGYVVFIPGTLEGETAEIKIVKIKSAYGYGKLLNIIKASLLRRTPECEVYGSCGGCQLMHMDYQEQLRLKERTVQDALKRIGGCNDFQWDGIIGMENPARYRNKMVFPIGRGKNGEPECGFYAGRSHRIIPLKDCRIGDGICRELIQVVLGYMKRYHVAPYEEEKHRGLVRRLFVRTGYKTGEIMVVLSVNGKTIPHADAFVKGILAVSDRVKSIILNCNEKRTNLVLGDYNITLWGRDTIEDELLGNRYTISPHSFYQVNPAQTQALYRTALDYAGIGNEDTVMDVYCGIGTISLSCARRAKHVTGIEIVSKAIDDARENARNNGIENVSFYCADAAAVVPRLMQEGERPDIVILDPPRKGSDEETLAAIAGANPKRIVYVSCNPATLARDILFLKTHGYVPQRVTAVDMFPETTHVETIVLLQRRDT